jgi:hypothetical protein
MQGKRAKFWISAMAIGTCVVASIVLYVRPETRPLQAYLIPALAIIPLSLVAGGLVKSVAPSWRNRHCDLLFGIAFCLSIATIVLLATLAGQGLDVGNLADPSPVLAILVSFMALFLFGIGSYDKLEHWRKKEGN